MDEINADDVRLSVSGVKELGHEAGVDRVSKEAATRIAFQEEKRIKEKMKLAQTVAKRAGRETVREEDLHVVEQILNAELPR